MKYYFYVDKTTLIPLQDTLITRNYTFTTTKQCFCCYETAFNTTKCNIFYYKASLPLPKYTTFSTTFI